ncbi:MAG: hypothetical protein ACXVDW_20580, partial [Bacteroidia bacterium]
ARSLSSRSKWRRRLTTRNSYIYVVGFIGLLCFMNYVFSIYGTFSKIHWFTLTKDLVDKLIDNRANNIATITSISLVVVGFLINNIKEKNKETYELLFTETKLYPIVYFILSVICLLLIVSFLRDTMDQYLYINFMILSMWLMLLVIVCIGFLFSKIIQFTDSTYLYTLFSNNLTDSAKQVIYREKISRLSKEILIERLRMYGIITSPFTGIGARHPNRINVGLNKETTVRDINVKKIEGCLRNLTPQPTQAHLDFSPISIYENIYPNFEKPFMYFSQDVVQQSTLRQAIKDYVCLMPKKKVLNFEDIKTSLLEKAKDAIDKNDIKTLKQIVSNYNALYELYYSNFKK